MSDAGALTVVLLLGMVAVAYLLAHFVVEWVQKRFLVVSGFEYILLGVLIGPTVVAEVNAFADLTALGPIIAFAAGWVGLLYGMELNFRALFDVSDHSPRLAIVEASVTAAVVGGVSYQVLASGILIDGLSAKDAAIAAWALGASAAAGSSGAVDLVRSRYRALETELLPLLRRSARIGDLLAILGFGLLFCVHHQGETTLAREMVYAEWFGISLLLGIGLGVLFTVFLGDTTDDNQRFLALTGILIFASGAAFFLHLSALLVNLLLGAVIVNTRHGKGVGQTLQTTQAPVRLVLLVFAGALWTPVPPGPAVAMAVGYVALRTMSKAAGGMLATFGTPMRTDLFRGLMAQGDVAIAMAIGFRLVYTGPAVDLAYTAILVAVVVHELTGPRLLKGLLIDAGEIRSDVDTRLPAPQRIERG